MTQAGIELQIRDSINSFVDHITSLVRSVAMDSVRSALGGDAVPARTGLAAAPAPAPRGVMRARSGRDRRSPDQIVKLADRLLAHVKAHPGQGMEQIRKALNTTTKILRLPVRNLIALKMIKFTGQKRGTKYQAV